MTGLRQLFNNLISAGKERRRHSEAKCLSRLEVDHQLEFGRALHWKVGGLFALKDAIDVTSQAMETLGCNSFMRCNADLNLASLRKTLRPAVSQLVDRRSALPNSQIKYGILLFIVRYIPLPSRSVSAIFTTVSG